MVPFVHGGVDTPTSVPVVIRVPRTTGAGGIPENNVLRVVAGYRVKGTGEARVATRDARLPLSLFVALAPPVKNSAYKGTALRVSGHCFTSNAGDCSDRTW